MTYTVKEIFYTLQGEGMNAGRAAVFLRFAGCNLWSGREADRAKGRGGCSEWCDTDFVGTDGDGGGRFDGAATLADAVARHWPACDVAPFVVCTGGEPLLQLDIDLIHALHDRGFYVAVETNGTLPVPVGVDWVCVSPKAGADVVVTRGDELKLVHPQFCVDPAAFVGMDFAHFILQPMDRGGREQNTAAVVRYCLDHPRWRVGLQTHKMLGIP